MWTWFLSNNAEEKAAYTLPHSLAGPIAFTKLVKKDKEGNHEKTVYLIGDWHVPKAPQTCPKRIQPAVNVSEFLQDVSELYPDHTIDVFVEVDADDYREADRDLSQEFFQIDADFHACKSGGGGRKNCQYPNIRYHWTDVRHRELIGVTIALEDTASTGEEALRDIIQSDLVEPWSELQKVYNRAKSFEKYRIQSRAVKKQLRKIRDPKLKAFLVQDLARCLDLESYPEGLFSFDLKVLLKQFVVGELSLRQLRNQPLFQAFEAFLHEGYINREVCAMDAYILGRMFKGGNRAPKNVIIYAGDFHTEHYREVLEKLGYQVTFRRRVKPRSQCLSFKGLTLPLFPDVSAISR